MKTLALIGGSNAMAHYGYGTLLKEKLKDECDIFAFGQCTIQLAVFTLLQNKIPGNYKYVLFQFNPMDSAFVHYASSSPYFIVSHLIYIASQFKDSETIPIFLNLPYLELGLDCDVSYILRAMAKILNIHILDFNKDFYYIPQDVLAPDMLHYNDSYQRYIADRIMNFIDQLTKMNIHLDDNPIQYELLDPGAGTNLVSEIVGTSWARRRMYKLTIHDRIAIPANMFLSGVFFMSTDNSPYLSYCNDHIRLCKSLRLTTHGLFYCRDIGYKLPYGLHEGYIGATWNFNYGIYDYTFGEETFDMKDNSCIYIDSFLICDRAPNDYGMVFYNDNYHSFEDEFKKSAENCISRARDMKFEFLNSMDDYLPNGKELFISIIQSRPDLHVMLNGPELVPEKLLLWAWQTGCQENADLRNIKSWLCKSIKELARVEYEHALVSGYSKLIHAIFLMRSDLTIFNVTTRNGQVAMMAWFNAYGIKEFNLEKVLIKEQRIN